MVVHAYKPSTWEEEAGRSQIWGQSGLKKKDFFFKKKKKVESSKNTLDKQKKVWTGG
jgi:hypothetical protein